MSKGRKLTEAEKKIVYGKPISNAGAGWTPRRQPSPEQDPNYTPASTPDPDGSFLDEIDE